MKSGDIVSLHWKVDENWCYGDAKGSSGLIPTKMVQVLSDQVQPVALCRALFDFDLNRLDPEDRKECLPFLKVSVYYLLSGKQCLLCLTACIFLFV